ncbi:MAG: ParB N-terminal domain-containing protein [Planctomycetota bacterium]
MRDESRVGKRDLPVGKLVPRSEHKTSKKHYQRIEASLRTVGLIEPLIVYDQGDTFEILDGNLRYEILLEMGVQTIPCVVDQTPPTNQEQTHE